MGRDSLKVINEGQCIDQWKILLEFLEGDERGK